MSCSALILLLMPVWSLCRWTLRPWRESLPVNNQGARGAAAPAAVSAPTLEAAPSCCMPVADRARLEKVRRCITDTLPGRMGGSSGIGWCHIISRYHVWDLAPPCVPRLRSSARLRRSPPRSCRAPRSELCSIGSTSGLSATRSWSRSE